MAWQLIYTSAPRLLEAGLTGLGTVARHRAIPPLVVKAVERISQFARLPGYDLERLIHCHRVLTVGGARFHVLSRLRDAGSDYSGRTNHIAHHLIVPAKEVSRQAASGVTPADVLLQMAWFDRWDRAPEWFEAAQDIALESFPPSAGTDRAWEPLTGNAEHRWLLVHGPAARGCCLIASPRAGLLPCLAASQRCQPPPQSWQAGFTTSLQPGDDLGDFRWIGLAADSPLRGIVGSSGRPVLDLSVPSNLPAPEIPRTAPPAPAARNSTPPPAAGKYSPPPPPHALGSISNPSSAPGARQRVSHGSGRNQETTERSWLLPALVAVVVLAGGASAWFLTRGSSRSPAQVPAEVSVKLQSAATNANNNAAIRAIKLSPADSVTTLGQFIQGIQSNPPPQTLKDALSELAELDQNLKNDTTVGSIVKGMFQVMEAEAWKLCLKAKPAAADFGDYSWTDAELGKKAAAAEQWLAQPGAIPGELASDPPAWMTTAASVVTPPKPTVPPVESGSNPPTPAAEGEKPNPAEWHYFLSACEDLPRADLKIEPAWKGEFILRQGKAETRLTLFDQKSFRVGRVTDEILKVTDAGRLEFGPKAKVADESKLELEVRGVAPAVPFLIKFGMEGHVCVQREGKVEWDGKQFLGLPAEALAPFGSLLLIPGQKLRVTLPLKKSLDGGSEQISVDVDSIAALRSGVNLGSAMDSLLAEREGAGNQEAFCARDAAVKAAELKKVAKAEKRTEFEGLTPKNSKNDNHKAAWIRYEAELNRDFGADEAITKAIADAKTAAKQRRQAILKFAGEHPLLASKPFVLQGPLVISLRQKFETSSKGTDLVSIQSR